MRFIVLTTIGVGVGLFIKNVYSVIKDLQDLQGIELIDQYLKLISDECDECGAYDVSEMMHEQHDPFCEMFNGEECDCEEDSYTCASCCNVCKVNSNLHHNC